MSRGTRWAAPLLACVAIAGCAGAMNYLDPAGPRYAARQRTSGAGDGCLRVVSFNIAYGQFPDRALALLRRDPELREADVLLLQEVDATATALLADSLGMSFVYYPAARHPFTTRDFGNAVLSRWPLEDDAKIILPHRARFGGLQRVAVAATVRFGSARVRVYSVHFATGITTGRREREAQLAAVLDDARRFPRVAVGGDFNSESLPAAAEAAGFAWPTRRLPATAAFWTVDHVLLRDLRLCREGAVGVRNDPFDTSDHLPIWIDLTPAPDPAR
jgi:endonuclease/exonuclease/phosphatase family metal-dependent hydrolase